MGEREVRRGKIKRSEGGREGGSEGGREGGKGSREGNGFGRFKCI